MEHLQGQILPALGAATRLQRPTSPAVRAASADGRRQTRPAERMDGEESGQTMKLVQRARPLTASAFLLGGRIHDAQARNDPRPPATPSA
jgi:hypothetical protein